MMAARAARSAATARWCSPSGGGSDLDRSPRRVFGGVVVAAGVGDAAEVVQHDADFGMVGSELRLEGGQGLAVEPIRVVDPAQVFVGDGQVVAQSRDLEVVGAESAAGVVDGGEEPGLGRSVATRDPVRVGTASLRFQDGDELVVAHVGPPPLELL